MKVKKQNRKILFTALIFFLLVVCFSCSKNVEVVKSEVDKVTEASETTFGETKETFVMESIDISDVSGDQYRNALLKIDELNHRIGKYM